MPCPEKDQTIYIQEIEVKTAKKFKYLRSLFDANGGANNDVNNRVNIAWSKWMETTGVMCDKNIPIQLKDKLYKTAIKPAMVYGAECWAVRRRKRGNRTQLKCACWAIGKTRLDYVRNVDSWKEARMHSMTARIPQKKRLKWFGRVQKRDKDEATRKILQMTVDGKRNRGRPKLRWRDLVKEDMSRNQHMTTEMADDRRHWHVMIRAGTLRSVGAYRRIGEKSYVQLKSWWLCWFYACYDGLQRMT